MARRPGAKTVHVPAAADAAPADATLRPATVIGVCTSDDALLATLRDAAPDVAVAGVETPQALADVIVARGCSAAFLDVRTLRSGIATLVPALARQFPTLPIVAIGTRDEEAAVARLIGSGEVYRFLHVPVSVERARTFVGAARRRADDLQQRQAAARATARNGGGGDDDADDADRDERPSDSAGAAARRAVPPPARAPAAPATDPARSAPPPSNFRAALFALTALGLVVAAGTTWLSRPGPALQTAAPADRVVADLVGAAGEAVAAGDLLAPAGRNAAEYYAQALARRPDDAEARASLLALADPMLSAGERALVGGRWQEAELAVATVALVRPRDPRVLALRARAAEARTTAAARAAAEAAPVTVAPDAPPVPLPSGNTDERAALEDARDTPSAPVAAATVVAAPGAGAAPATNVPPPTSTAGTPAASPATDAAAPHASASPPDPPDGVAPAGPAQRDPLAPGVRPNAAVVPPSAPPTRRAPLRRIADAAVVYPARARARGIEGWVDVAFTVDPTGRVTDARVLSAQPAGTFDEAALDAVGRWRYAPVPAPQDANVRLRFQLDR